MVCALGQNLVNDKQISKYYILFLVKDVLKISAVILNFLSNTTTIYFLISTTYKS